jgi:hypothetical protein
MIPTVTKHTPVVSKLLSKQARKPLTRKDRLALRDGLFQEDREKAFNRLIADVEKIAGQGAADAFLASYTQPDTTWSDLNKALLMWAKDECLPIHQCPACYGRGKELTFGLYDNMLPGDCGRCAGLGYEVVGEWVIGEQTFEVIQ